MNTQQTLPAEFINHPIWVCHKNKQPINPHNGRPAKSNDLQTWGTYQEAVEARRRYNLDGIGIQFGLDASANLGLSGIDLDHVLRDDGTLEPFADEIVKSMNSYTEISPSGTGLHILCYTNLDNIGNKTKVDSCALEMYNHGRYFTYTGNIFGPYSKVEERTEKYREIHAKYFPETASKIHKNSYYYDNNDNDFDLFCFQEPQIKETKVEFREQEILVKMFDSKNGDKIKKLYNGDISGYPSHSEADLALLTHLLFWTQKDVHKALSLFEKSGLMRDKWNKSEYRKRTIETALQNLTNVHEPNYSPHNVFNPDVVDTSGKLPLAETSGEDITHYLDNSLEKDATRFAKYKDRKTGFSNIDNKTNLYPGLYVLGAISSLGKTTFACQLADQLAKAGEHVLYFSLEQSKFELVTKGLSRLTAKSNKLTAVTAMQIREGVRTLAVLKAIEEYKNFGQHNIIYQCGFDTTVRTIIDCVNDYIKSNDVQPIVIVDYLQIIRPMDSRRNVKDVVDDHLRAFKKLQIDNDLVVLLISSLNRQNYLTPLSFESFKESGSIEYTADIMWGLQLNVMNDEIFEQDKGTKGKRDIVLKAKSALPREIELVCLKNRPGKTTYNCNFNYYAQFDYFEAVNDFNHHRVNQYAPDDFIPERPRKSY